MSHRRPFLWPIVSAVVGLLVFVVALPQQWKSWAPGMLGRPSLHLGLDLAGGTQLDFRVSEEELQSQLESVRKDLDVMQKSGGDTQKIGQLQAEERSITDQRGNLIDMTAFAIRPKPPLIAINRSKLPRWSSPFVPNFDAVFLKIPDIGIALEKPQQLMKNRSGMKLLGRDQRKTPCKIIADLTPEDRESPSPGTITLLDSIAQHIRKERKILSHGFPLFTY